MTRYRHTLTPLLAALLAALALGACGRKDDTTTTTGQKVDSAIAKVEQKADEAKADMSRGAEQAKESAKEATQEMKQAASEATDKVKTAVTDAAITTAVNAELTKDGKLSALKIDVDTSQGKVTLRGTAPDPDSKDRATRLAAGVKGVGSVDNFLTVEAKS